MMELIWSMTGSWRHIGRESDTIPMCADGLSVSHKSRNGKVVHCSRGRSSSMAAEGIKLQITNFQMSKTRNRQHRGQRCRWASLTPWLLPKRKSHIANSFNEGDYKNLNDLSLDHVSVYKQDERRISEAEGAVQEEYVGLSVRLLGLDYPVEDREEAVQALRRHSVRGKEFIDQIVKSPSCLNLIVSLLPSDRPATSEAAAGLLRNISSVHAYRSAVAEAGALEEIAGLLTRRSLCSKVKEQATCVLWNLSVEEGPRKKLVQPVILQVLLSMLGSHIVGEREASAGVISNLALSLTNHEVLVDAGIIPKLARILLNDKESKVARQEARSALLELARDQHVKSLIIEEGLVLVPPIRTSAYRSFKPFLQAVPSLPDSVKVQLPISMVESRLGAGELLLGLNLENAKTGVAARLSIEGKVREQFLARIGLLGNNSTKSHRSGNERIALLPWWAGIPRLILILGLDDLTVAGQAALAIAEIAFSEENRQAMHRGGAIPHLVRLLGSGDEDATAAAAFALDKLAISPQIRQSINAHDGLSVMVAILKGEDASDYVKEKVVGALFRLSQTKGEVEDITQAGVIPGLMGIVHSDNASVDGKEEAKEILEEISSLKADPRDKIVAAGGVRPLLDIIMDGSPGQAEKAICVLENLATQGSNSIAIIQADVELALALLLDVDCQGGLMRMRHGKAMSKGDSYVLIGAASRLLEKLARYERVKTSLFTPLLTNILQSDVPLRVKDCVSACLLKLDQVSLDHQLEVLID